MGETWRRGSWTSLAYTDVYLSWGTVIAVSPKEALHVINGAVPVGYDCTAVLSASAG